MSVLFQFQILMAMAGSSDAHAHYTAETRTVAGYFIPSLELTMLQCRLFDVPTRVLFAQSMHRFGSNTMYQ